MAVKLVCFAELLVKVGSANFAWPTCVWKSKQAKKTPPTPQKEPCCSCTPGLVLRPSSCLKLGYSPPFLLPKLRGEQAEGFAYTAEPTSLQNLECMARHTTMPPSAHPGHTPSRLKTRVSTSLHHPVITCADGKYAAWQQTCFFPQYKWIIITLGRERAGPPNSPF